LEDANSIQIAIMQVLNLLLTGRIVHKTAVLALYGLRAASSNLRRTSFDPYPHDVVINPATVNRTRMGQEIWKDSEFDVKLEEKKKKKIRTPKKRFRLWKICRWRQNPTNKPPSPRCQPSPQTWKTMLHVPFPSLSLSAGKMLRRHRRTGEPKYASKSPPV
jgi:hypothetical protein